MQLSLFKYRLSMPFHETAYVMLFLRIFFISLLTLQLVYMLSVHMAYKESHSDQENSVALRMSLDVSHIKSLLPIEAGESLDVSADSHYIKELNQRLEEQSYDYSVVNVSLTPIDAKENNHVVMVLPGINDDLYIEMTRQSPPVFRFISVWPVLFALVFSVFVSARLFQSRTNKQIEEPVVIEPCILQVDLHAKQLVNPRTQVRVDLANKPLCFYTALIELGIQDPERQLNPSKDLPDDVEIIAKKYFARLIELGHTIRKRPDFSNNVEKTLSEIRAALDEVYGDDIHSKEFVYPKKAVGEGSRSKAHNYALNDLSGELVEVLGN